MTADPAGAFERATRIRTQGVGRYTAELDPAWDAPFGPNGGYLAAILLRAAQQELARSELPPRIVTVHYPRPATHEPAEIAVETLRVGRRNATLQTRLIQGGKLICTALMTFSAPRPQALTLTAPAPPAPSPDEVEEVRIDAVEGTPRIFGRVQLRPCFGAPMLAGAPEAVTGGWMALRDDDQPLDGIRLTALTDMWWPAVFGAVRELVGAPTLELTVHLRSTAPISAPILARFATCTIDEGHLEETARLWSADGKLLAEGHQLALLV
jgi:acyl-CoA thioesterase